MTDKYKSEAMQVIHEDMKGMKRLGIMSWREASLFLYAREPESAATAAPNRDACSTGDIA